MDFIKLPQLVAAMIYSLMGILMFIGIFAIIDWISPKDIWSEIVDKQNSAMAILAGFSILGICIIIAAAFTG